VTAQGRKYKSTTTSVIQLAQFNTDSFKLWSDAAAGESAMLLVALRFRIQKLHLRPVAVMVVDYRLGAGEGCAFFCLRWSLGTVSTSTSP